MKILVRIPSELKEAVFAEPAINCLRKNHPDDEIWAAGPDWAGDLFDGRGLFDGLVNVPADENLKDMRDSIVKIRRMDFSAALVLNDSFGAVLLAYASGIPKRWGFRREGTLLILTKSVNPVESIRPRHRAEHYLDLVEGLGLECDRRVPLLEVPDEEKRRAGKMPAAGMIKQDRPFIVMAPDSDRGQIGRWPAERFAETAERLHKETGVPIMLLATEHDDPSIKEAAALLSFKPLLPPADMDLKKLMGLLASSSLVIAGDNIALHLASALGVPVAALFGPSDPEVFGPLVDKRSIVYGDATCRPCRYTECPWDHRCLLNITSEMVFAAAKNLL